MCPTCWEVRNRTVPEPRPQAEFALPNAALAVGLVALIPGCWPLQIAGYVVGGISLAKNYQTPGRARVQSIVALVLTVLGSIVTAFIVFNSLMNGFAKA